jgi:hypothetical protein
MEYGTDPVLLLGADIAESERFVQTLVEVHNERVKAAERAARRKR